MIIEVDEYKESLRIGDEEFWSSTEGHFDVLASCLRNAMLSDLPQGVSVSLCERVIGGHELFCRNSFKFEHTVSDTFSAHSQMLFYPPEEAIELGDSEGWLKAELARGRGALAPLIADRTVFDLAESVFEDDYCGYLSYSVNLVDQPIFDAEAYMNALEMRVYEGLSRPLLFICHASEDKPFVDRLVAELDRRALHAWYDKREILVGDSIVAKINEGLSQARYVGGGAFAPISGKALDDSGTKLLFDAPTS